MIENSSANIKLTTEQLLQIDIFQKTLANLQSEIEIHSKNLQISRNDSIRLGKERDYLQGLVINLEEKKLELEKQCENISNAVLEYQRKLDTAVSDYKTLKLLQESELSEIELQMKQLNEKKIEIQASEDDLSKKLDKFVEENALLEKKKQILSEALKSI